MSENRNVCITDNINASTFALIKDSILKINKEDDDRGYVDNQRKPINMYIDTNGGSLYKGLGIISAMESSITPINTYTYGYCMSMGIIIASCGKKRFAGKYANFMYHQASSFKGGFLEEIEESLEQSKYLQTTIENILLSNTKIVKAKLEEINEHKRNWFITAKEALELGIIDAII